MDRNTLMWTLVVFFGATVLFGAIRTATEGEGVGIQLGAQAVAALLLVAALILFVRRRR